MNSQELPVVTASKSNPESIGEKASRAKNRASANTIPIAKDKWYSNVTDNMSNWLILCFCTALYFMCKKRERGDNSKPHDLTQRSRKIWKLTVAVIYFFASVAVVFLPTKESETAVMAENLYTSNGQWQKPKPRIDNDFTVDWWTRKEFGIKWAWLVVDTGISCDAWYAKVEPLYFCVYLLIAFVPSAGFLILERIRREAKDKE